MSKPKTRTCSHCSGTGKVEGTFAHRPWDCLQCDGFGVVDAETGFGLTRSEQVAYLQDQLAKRDNTITRLQAEVARLEPYRAQAAAKELAEQVYPKHITEARRRSGQGGYGD